jgi:hypothetical protein
LDLDPSILRALKVRQKRENKPLGQLVSELLAPALETEGPPVPDFHWTTADLQPRVDLDDKEAVRRVLDRS